MVQSSLLDAWHCRCFVYAESIIMWKNGYDEDWFAVGEFITFNDINLKHRKIAVILTVVKDIHGHRGQTIKLEIALVENCRPYFTFDPREFSTGYVEKL